MHNGWAYYAAQSGKWIKYTMLIVIFLETCASSVNATKLFICTLTPSHQYHHVFFRHPDCWIFFCFHNFTTSASFLHTISSQSVFPDHQCGWFHHVIIVTEYYQLFNILCFLSCCSPRACVLINMCKLAVCTVIFAVLLSLGISCHLTDWKNFEGVTCSVMCCKMDLIYAVYLLACCDAGIRASPLGPQGHIICCNGW